MTFRQAVFGLLLFLTASLIGHPVLAAAPVVISAVGSIEDMQALDGAARPVVQLLAYHSGGSQGGGLFVWNPAASGPADNCLTFSGRKQTKGLWVRKLSGPLDPTMCGAWWDNVHDDAEALTRTLAVAASNHTSVSLPGGRAKVCSTVKAARAVVVRGQGMGTDGDNAPSPTMIDASCMKSGWVFDFTTPDGGSLIEAPKYYDMEIATAHGSNPGGCIRWNRADGGFVDGPNGQLYMMHPHAERIFCGMGGDQQIGFECSKCFDGDFSQNLIINGKTGIALEGSDVMCIGCAGPNRLSYSNDALIRMVAHGTFGNMDRVVGNEILYPQKTPARYDAFIYDNSRSSTIESNHIEGIVPGVQSAIHVVGGFSHAIENNDIDVLSAGGRTQAAPHWLVTEGPFVNFRAFNNGCGGCIMGPALFKNHSPDYNAGGVRQVITHGGNAANGDAGFP